jgi:hypothetical protein
MISEKMLQHAIITLAKKRGVFVAKMEAIGQRGFPDLLLIANGRSLYMEIKSPTGKGRLSALQVRMIENMRNHGAQVVVVSDFDDAAKLIENMLL